MHTTLDQHWVQTNGPWKFCQRATCRHGACSRTTLR